MQQGPLPPVNVSQEEHRPRPPPRRHDFIPYAQQDQIEERPLPPSQQFRPQAYPPQGFPEVELSRERYVQPCPSGVRANRPRYYDRQEPFQPRPFESQIDVTEREYRRRNDPNFYNDYSRPYQPPVQDVPTQVETAQADCEASPRPYAPPIREAGPQPYPYESNYARPAPPRINHDVTANELRPRYYRPAPKPAKRAAVLEKPTVRMGYYDDDGEYHSFRRGVERAATRIAHPFDDPVPDTRIAAPVPAPVRYVEPRRGNPPGTVPIPCHFIRIGDLLVLQGRPSQVIRITTSAQTGQHRYLGVDLFTRQLHEESSFVSNPAPSVIVQSMLGPVFKTYRVLDVREDGRVVAMTELGDVKQNLPVLTQDGLFERISAAFADGRGSVRILVITDSGRDLVVDFKVIHGSRL